MASRHDVYSHPSRVEHWRHVVEIVALLLAAAWALYVFVYQERVKPDREPPALEVEMHVTHQLTYRGKELVSVSVIEKNIGTPTVQIDGFVMNVYGVRYRDRNARIVRRNRSSIDVFRTLGADAPVLLASHAAKFRSFGGSSYDWLRPGRAKSPTQSFAIVPGSYDAVRVEYAFCYQRADYPGVKMYRMIAKPDGSVDSAALMALDDISHGVRDDHVFCGISPGSIFGV